MDTFRSPTFPKKGGRPFCTRYKTHTFRWGTRNYNTHILQPLLGEKKIYNSMNSRHRKETCGLLSLRRNWSPGPPFGRYRADLREAHLCCRFTSQLLGHLLPDQERQECSAAEEMQREDDGRGMGNNQLPPATSLEPRGRRLNRTGYFFVVNASFAGRRVLPPKHRRVARKKVRSRTTVAR